MAVPTFTKAGVKAQTPAKLDKAVFGVEEISPMLIKSAYEAYLANGRDNIAKTKKRGEVRGGGRKPWRQKGTGRARVGSTRSPIWRGGGITFGPSGEENYKHKLPVKAKRQALRQALSAAAKDNQVIVIEELSLKAYKTKEMAKFLQKIGATKRSLVVLDDVKAELASTSANLQNSKLIQANYLNVFDVMNADHIVLSREALKVTSDWLGDK
ncbi:MAG TPA: 50S ribosomal protein L4 [Candidatus Saccharimonadales bacterium]|nr:50S ribosomal protein L4 [Candidatus Saccharimonadales bacterium]